MTPHPDWIVPDWPAPANVRAFVTTRSGGVSEGDYASMNVGLSSGDDPARVRRNREILERCLPAAPALLRQVHGTVARDLDDAAAGETADAAFTRTPRRVAAVLTADCMPLFLADAAGTRVAVAHAGWRGMAAGVIEATVRAMEAPGARWIAWMGPTIGPDAFEVGAEVREAFMAADPAAARAFRAHKPGKFIADLYALARMRLAAAGVREVFGGGFCTFHEAGRFFSYRRVARSGRMASCIWMA